MITFYQWLKVHVADDTPVGEVARRITSDESAPIGAGSVRMWREHLRSGGASTESLDAFEQAWSQYANYVSKRCN